MQPQTSSDSPEYEQEDGIQRIASIESRQIIQRSYTQKDCCLDLNGRTFIQVLSAIQKFGRKRIVKLKLQSDQINNNRLKNIWRRINTKNLQQLYLYRNELNGKCFKTLKIRSMEKLRILRLSLNQIGDLGIQRLIKADLKYLEKLELKETRLRCKGIKRLIKGNWPQLIHLDITSCSLNPDAILLLYTHNFKKLNTLWLGEYCYCKNQEIKYELTQQQMKYIDNYKKIYIGFWIFTMAMVLFKKNDKLKIPLPYTSQEIGKSVKVIFKNRLID